MTKEEMINALLEKGIPVGNWKETEGKEVKSPILEKQRENLQKLYSLLEKQIENDVETMADLHITLQKIKGRKDAK